MSMFDLHSFGRIEHLNYRTDMSGPGTGFICMVTDLVTFRADSFVASDAALFQKATIDIFNREVTVNYYQSIVHTVQYSAQVIA